MKKLTAFYFSGTGNTRYVTNKLCERLSEGFATSVFDISDAGERDAEIKRADCVLLAFPIYGSSPPVPMRRFLYAHANALKGKEVIIAITQYLFSGDGAASLGRAAEKCGARVTYAEHFRMPNNISDSGILKIRNGKENAELIARTDRRIDAFARKILAGKRCKRGFDPVSHAVGYLCQRALWRRHENDKKGALVIDTARCTGCGLCAKRCPANNLRIENGKASARGECALCYRCVNLCPRAAITLTGKSAPLVQYRGPDLKI